jgi:Tol biopolymer transport system component
MDVYLYTADGGNVMKWTDVASYDEQPAWSPDGQWIAFFRKDRDTNGNGRLDRRDDGEYSNLWIGHREGSEFRQLTFDNHAADPAWSPDGRHIVFAHFRDSTGDGWVGLDDASDLWVVPVAGGEPRVLLQGPQQDWAPDWTR